MDAAGLPEIVGTVWARESAGEQPKLCNQHKNTRRSVFCGWAWTVSNRRPLVCKTRALPLSYTPVPREC